MDTLAKNVQLFSGLRPFSAVRHASVPWIEAGFLAWILFILALPILIVRNIPPEIANALYIEARGHLLVEGFCGVVALMIAGMILWIGARQKDRAVCIVGSAFLAMGMFDILHAATDPHGNAEMFVLFHTLSTLSGGTLVLAGTLEKIRSRSDFLPSLRDVIAVLIGVCLIAPMVYIYNTFLPDLGGNVPGIFSFSPLAHNAHGIAALFYAITAIIFVRYFGARRQFVALVVASLLILFAESAYLFSFSKMWDFNWWMWHGVKVTFYLGILLTVIVGFLMALNTIERSRHVLAKANARLQKTQAAVKQVNQELEILNRMARDAMTSLDLGNALDVISRAVAELLGVARCELVLKVPDDEVSELQRIIQGKNGRWSIRGQNAACPHFPLGCEPIDYSQVRLFQCPVGEAGARYSICIPVAASGQEVGHLRLMVPDPEHVRTRLGQLQSLPVEIGAIINNALLYHRWIAATEFRSALLRVSAMLTSTLYLNQVLESVCRESARLLDSDGALVWLTSEDGKGFTLASRCFCEQHECDATAFESWFADGAVCDRLLLDAEGRYRPRSMLRGRGDGDEPDAPEVGQGGEWGALAMFPLVEEKCLIGIMAMMRKEPVEFSSATLAKGELLAGQARIAINNARSYKRLSEINDQLRIAEESKIRGERLAALGQMAASVAHEIRNPLSAITNCLAVLRAEHSLDGNAGMALEIIQGEVQRLGNLAYDFLIFGRPTAAKVKPVVLENLLIRVCANLRRHIVHEGLPITVDSTVEEISAPILFDADGLEMVLWNLLLNAVQSIDGPGKIHTAFRGGPRHFLLVVADAGRGIPAGEKHRIFEPFYSTKSYGAGLGLAIVHRFVQEWDGRIKVFSKPGEGTTFIIRVPVEREEIMNVHGRLQEHYVNDDAHLIGR